MARRRPEFLRDGRQKLLNNELTCWTRPFAHRHVFKSILVECLKGSTNHLLFEGHLRRKIKSGRVQLDDLRNILGKHEAKGDLTLGCGLPGAVHCHDNDSAASVALK